MYKQMSLFDSNNVPEWAKWLARNKNGDLWAHSDKPHKGKPIYWITTGENLVQIIETDDTYSYITWEDEEPTLIDYSEPGTGPNMVKPAHYRTNMGKYIDLYDKWYHEHDLETFRAIMRSVAERYIIRYEFKNGIEDLNKGIYTLERLKEYEEK